MDHHTILWISSSRNSYTGWASVFTDPDIQVLRVNELEYTLGQFAHMQIDLVILEAGGIVKDDIDLCCRLRKRFDSPLILLTTNVTEDFAVAAYGAGVDECILGHISPDLLRAKVGARIRSIERMARDPAPLPPEVDYLMKQPVDDVHRFGH